MPNRVVALALSTHPLPGLAVTAIAVVLAVASGLEWWRVLVLGLAFGLNQASVGLSNDWLDAERDRAVGRTDKPVARGDLSRAAARTAAFVAAGAALALTVPLGWAATGAHAVFLLGAWAYNLGLKATPLSVLPYVVSFGILPLVVTLARPEPALAPWWALLAGALLGIAAHFANVLPDLQDDAATGIRGLPHRLGRRTVGLTIAAALLGAAAAIVFGAGEPALLHLVGFVVSAALGLACGVLVVLGRGSRWMFRLIILAAIVDVVLLAIAGRLLVG